MATSHLRSMFVVAIATCLVAAAPSGAASPVVDATECGWSNDSMLCDVSPAFVVASFAATTDGTNAFTASLLQTYAEELLCNQAGTNEACAAAAGCVYNADAAPACHADWDATNNAFARSQLCEGSLAASSLVCSWATNETCATAGNCTWSEEQGDCESAEILAMSQEQLVQYGDHFGNFDAGAWGNCSNFLSYRAFVTACSSTTGAATVAQEECTSFGATCSWEPAGAPGEGRCVTTSVALIRGAFAAAAGSAPALAGAACVAAKTAEVCETTGEPVQLDGGLLEALAAGNFSAAADGARTAAGGVVANATGGAQKGAAGAARVAGGAVVSGVLLAALMVA